MKNDRKILRLLFMLLLAALQFSPEVQAKEAAVSAAVETDSRPAVVLKLDREDKAQLPKSFRMGTTPFTKLPKNGVLPIRLGLDSLRVSASSAFSEKEFAEILKTIPAAPDKFYDVDLRGESHGYIDGMAVSWYAKDDFGNDGRSLRLIEGIEKQQLAQLPAKSPVQVYQLKKKTLTDPLEVEVGRVRTEKQLVEEHGAHYFRLALTDHFRPEDADVDAYLEFYKKLPADAWVHYHCFAGHGRTTTFMVMHDILKNAGRVSFEDIVSRQGLIGVLDLSDIDGLKDWRRKAAIERYEFARHFYDYVKANPQLTSSWTSWARKQGYASYVPDYSGYIWRIDAANEDKLPRNFRTTNSPYKAPEKKYNFEPDYIPTRAGLDTLKASGSAEFSAGEFAQLTKAIRQQTSGPVYIVDLRQESHGLFNGTAVSWYGEHDWGNVDKTSAAALADEQKRLQAAQGKTQLVAQLSGDKLPEAVNKVAVTQAMTEEELVRQAGLHYFRITATDHVWPAPECIDRFVAFYKQLPADAWLHFHCEAGVGRTTAYMAMYDMMRNPTVSLRDILYRQHMLGGNYVAYTVENPKKNDWKADYYNEKARMIPLFYQYVQENQADNFKVTWSQWLLRQQ